MRKQINIIPAIAQSRLFSEQQKITEELKKHIDQLQEQTCEESTCPFCRTIREAIGETRTEELRIIPAKAGIDVHVMNKYDPCG